ncbi:MAG: hypothetical protein ABI361_04470 [Nitrososphaera sp.]
MSPKRRVLLTSLIFAALGVSVSLGIIASGGGFGSGASIFNPPTDKDVYHVGQGIHNGTALTYNLDSVGPNSSLKSAKVSMVFHDTGKDWRTAVSVTNASSPTKQETLNFSRQLTIEGEVPKDFRPYYEPVKSSILNVLDMSFNGGQPKYFVIGAPWDTLIYGSSYTTIRVTGKEDVTTPAGTFNAFVLSYQLQNQTSKIWFPHDAPFPVKAQVFDQQDQPLYSYQLLSNKTES